MRETLNKGLWVVFILLTPLTFIGLFSQNSIPGDLLYPVKLGFEKAGSLVFAITPTANASYNNTLSDRRFQEAQKLLLEKQSTAGLTDLIAQTEKTQTSITRVEDTVKKTEVEEKLVQSIEHYQEELTQIQKTVDPLYIPPPTPTLQPFGQNPQDSVYVPPPVYLQPTMVQPTIFYPSPTPLPTNTPQNNNYTENSQIPTQPPEISQPDLLPPAEIVSSIEDTKTQLEEIKRQIIQTESQSLQMDIEQKTNPGRARDKDIRKEKNKERKTELR